MKINLKFFGLVCMLGLITACSSISVSQDYESSTNFTGLQTYRWDAALEQKEKDLKGDPLLNKRIHSAIDSTFATKGYQLSTDKKSDFIVSFHIEVRQRLTSDGASSGVSVGFGNFGNFAAIGLGTGSTVHDEDEATLIIDILDGRDNSLIWRGNSTRYVYTHTTPEALTKTINQHVVAILAQFPPTK